MTPNKDMPAFPTISWDQLPNGNVVQYTDQPGLTKREQIAAMIDCSKDIDDYPVAFFKELIGRDMPENQIEKYKYFAECEAMLRVIKAEALLAELSKEYQP